VSQIQDLIGQMKMAAAAENYALAAELQAQIKALTHTKLGQLPDSEVCPSRLLLIQY
jgi:excinuclease UvrABC nuclease subunit